VIKFVSDLDRALMFIYIFFSIVLNLEGRILPGICVHPRSLPRGGRAVLHSENHTSTGSTVDTFLTQDDLMYININAIQNDRMFLKILIIDFAVQHIL
jgi:hypothetical protein